MNEFDLIHTITKDLPTRGKDIVVGIGDDCAVVRKNANTYLLATIDAQVANIHFLLNKVLPASIGKKAMSVNISDIAAMGGVPTYCLVSLFIPKNLQQSFIEDMYTGIKEAAKKYGIAIIGGNITRSEQLAVDVTLLGEINRKQLLLRSTAQVGDAILVTGTLGDAAAGLYLLQHPKNSLPKKEKEYLVSKQTTPTPRLKEARIISRLGHATAMIDVSDGIAQDMLHITQQSGVGCMLYEEKLPLSHELTQFCRKTGKDITALALTGGEDYELLFTVPPTYVPTIKKMIAKHSPILISEIGIITAKEDGTTITTKEGKKRKLLPNGWNHLIYT